MAFTAATSPLFCQFGAESFFSHKTISDRWPVPGTFRYPGTGPDCHSAGGFPQRPGQWFVQRWIQYTGNGDGPDSTESAAARGHYQGELILPANAPADARLPAVVLVHGAGGVFPEERTYWAKLLNERGIAVFVIDVFSPRGVKSAGEDQSLVPVAADTADAFAALGMLAGHPRIDTPSV
ncbi:MAG: hypothetical protein PHR71_11575 [Polaromonas sp.]|nr:hypothetical protein [Polaromonas sp.]